MSYDIVGVYLKSGLTTILLGNLLMCILVILTFVFAINLTPFSEKVMVFINIFSMCI